MQDGDGHEELIKILEDVDKDKFGELVWQMRLIYASRNEVTRSIAPSLQFGNTKIKEEADGKIGIQTIQGAFFIKSENTDLKYKQEGSPERSSLDTGLSHTDMAFAFIVLIIIILIATF